MDKSLPLISVIVPVYNVEKYVKKCVGSLLCQTYKNCEFIFIDDGSTDDSVEALQKNQDDRMKIIRQENKGVSLARNAGLNVAKGEYVVFVDADDFVAEDYVEYLYNLISARKADFAYSMDMFKSKKDKQNLYDNVELVDSDKSTGILLSPDTVVCSFNKIYRRSVIEKNNLRYDPDLYYGEGLNFIIKMSLVSKKIVVGNRKILYYRKNNMSSATTEYNNDRRRNGLKSLEAIGNIINRKNNFVNSMYRLHIANYYLGVTMQILANGKRRECRDDYVAWRTDLKSSMPQILKDEYVSAYRKSIIVAGVCFPYLTAEIDKIRRKKIIRNSVD